MSIKNITFWFSNEKYCSCIVWSLVFGSVQVPSCSWLYGSWIYIYLCSQCLSPLMLWVLFLSLRRYDKVCRLFVAGGLFFTGTPVSSTTKNDLHAISEILLKVNTHKPKQFERKICRNVAWIILCTLTLKKKIVNWKSTMATISRYSIRFLWESLKGF
jgi:hypothetical protein